MPFASAAAFTPDDATARLQQALEQSLEEPIHVACMETDEGTPWICFEDEDHRCVVSVTEDPGTHQWSVQVNDCDDLTGPVLGLHEVPSEAMLEAAAAVPTVLL